MTNLEAIILDILQKIHSIRMSTLDKYLFLIDGAFFSQYNKTITGIEYIMYPYGIAPIDHMDLYRDLEVRNILTIERERNGVIAIKTYSPSGKPYTTLYKALIQESHSIINKNNKIKKILDKVLFIFSSWDNDKLDSFLGELYGNIKMYTRVNNVLNYMFKDNKFLEESFEDGNFYNILIRSG